METTSKYTTLLFLLFTSLFISYQAYASTHAVSLFALAAASNASSRPILTKEQKEKRKSLVRQGVRALTLVDLLKQQDPDYGLAQLRIQQGYPVNIDFNLRYPQSLYAALCSSMPKHDVHEHLKARMRPLLVQMAHLNNAPMVRAIIAAKGNVNIHNSYTKETPLMVCTSPEITAALLHAGADRYARRAKKLSNLHVKDVDPYLETGLTLRTVLQQDIVTEPQKAKAIHDFHARTQPTPEQFLNPDTFIQAFKKWDTYLEEGKEVIDIVQRLRHKKKGCGSGYDIDLSSCLLPIQTIQSSPGVIRSKQFSEYYTHLIHDPKTQLRETEKQELWKNFVLLCREKKRTEKEARDDDLVAMETI